MMQSKKTIVIVLLSIFSMLLVTSNVYATSFPTEVTFTDTIGDNNVNIYANGGKFSDDSNQKSLKCDDANLLCTHSQSELIPTRDGYDFAGWSTSQSSTNICIDHKVGIYYPKYTKLYACWIEKPTESVTVSESGCYYCQNYEHSFGTTTTKYKFFRANDKLTSDCSGATKDDAYIQSHPNTFCLKKDSTIHLYPNGGKGEFAVSRYCSNNDKKCPINTSSGFTRDGYTLTGWSTKEDQSDYINPYSSTDYSAYDKLYAYWTKDEDLKKATTEGCYFCENLSYFYPGSSYEYKHLYLEQNAIIPNGCNETVVNSGYRKYGNAYCISNVAAIDLDANGGKFPDDNSIKLAACTRDTYKCTTNGEAFVPTREDYIFYGWSKTNDSKNCFSNTETIYYGDYDKLYACWQREVVVVPDPITSSTTTTTTRTMPVTHPAITLPNNNNNNNNNNNSNNSSETPVPESPKTGVEDYILGLFLSLVVLGIAFVLINNKKQFFKKI